MISWSSIFAYCFHILVFSEYFEELLSRKLKVEVLENNSVVNFTVSKSVTWLYSARCTCVRFTHFNTDCELLMLWWGSNDLRVKAVELP